MILTKKKSNIDQTQLTSIILGLFPISFIFGNLITNINILLFCFLGIFLLRSKILETKFNLPIKVIFLFFLSIFFSTCISFARAYYLEEYESYDLTKLLKSLAFFKFFLLILIIYLLNSLNLLNFKFFFISASLAPFLISLDVIYQYIFGFDIIGLKSLGTYNSSFFGDELIAGGYIKGFAFFSIVFSSFIFKEKIFVRFIFTLLAVSILGTGILLSGNRMPFVLFLMGLFLFFLINKNLRFSILSGLLLLLLIFIFISSSNSGIKEKYTSYINNTQHILLTTLGISKKIKPETILREEKSTKSDDLDIKENEFEIFKKPPKWDKNKALADDFEFFWIYKVNAELDHHTKLFNTALNVWKKNKIFGNGIKSFREDCKQFLIFQEYGLCSNHPHNYYLEILTEAGIVGLSLSMLIGLLFIIFVFKNFKILRNSNLDNLIFLAIVISIILEVFPFKSTGSIFSTSNMTYLALIASILLSYRRKLDI